MSELERSTVVLQALDTLSGFNSALAIQVNSTRQDVRITKEKLREEERQNREAQQSLEHWSREVESERQLLFEAMAYLNDDVRSPVPDIEKIQSDIKRLKDFIAYKVKHSDEERDQYRSQSSNHAQGQSPSKRGIKNQLGEETNVDDATASKLLLLNDKDRTYDSRDQSLATGLNHLELERIKSEALRHKEEAVIAKGDAEESRSKLDRSEAEAASFIGRIVAEKESLCGDRDMLILQLTKATTESGFLRETIASLKQDVIDAGMSVKRADIDMKIEGDAALCREQKLKNEIEEQKRVNTAANCDLSKVGVELMQSLKANSGLSDHIRTLESVLMKERAGREKERAALGASLSAIDDLTINVKLLKIKDAEREVALEKISSLERDAETLRFEQFTLQEAMMATRAELEESDEVKARLEMKIESLLAQKEEYESGIELLYLRSQVGELKDIIINSERETGETERIFAVRLASSQKEIERLALDLLESQSEIQVRDESRAEVEYELKSLQDRVKGEEEERARGDAVALVVAQSAEVKLTIAELVLSLQHNRQLAGEIEVYKEKLEEEREKSVAIQESALHSITLKAQQVEAVIDSSKATLYRAAGQVEEMKAQMLIAETERSDVLVQLDDSEARTETVRTALHSAMIELEKKEREQQGLEYEIQRLVREKEEAAQHALRQAAMAATAEAARAEQERLTSLRAELAHMTQLKDLAETRAAALALVGGGSRVYDAVHALSVRTGDYSNRIEEDTYAPLAQPMDFEQYKRLAGSIVTAPLPVPVPVPYPQSQPVPYYPSHSITTGQSPRYADPSPPGPYSYPPVGPGRAYTLDDFQGSDDSFAGNPGMNRYGQRPAQSLILNRNMINGSSRPQGVGSADIRPLPPSLSPRSRTDKHDFQFSDIASVDHGLSFNLAHGGGGKPPSRGDGPLRGVYKERGGALHSPSPSRINPEQALLMSDNENESVMSCLSGARYAGSRSDGGNDGRNEGIDIESDRERERERDRERERERERERDRDRELKASAEEKTSINALAPSPSDDDLLSPVSKANKVKARSPWISTFKSNGGNWNYTPPILPRSTAESLSLSRPAHESEIPDSEDFTGSPPKSPVDPAGKRVKEYRSVDEYFLQ